MTDALGDRGGVSAVPIRRRGELEHTKRRHEDREEVLGDIEAVLLPRLERELGVALVDVVRRDPEVDGELELGKVERLHRGRCGKHSGTRGPMGWELTESAWRHAKRT